VNANPARFDVKKCEAVNASHIRLLDPKELAEHLVPFLVRAGLVADPPTPGEQERLEAATPLIQERISTLSEAVDMLAFLFRRDEDIRIEPDAGLTAGSAAVLDAAEAALGGLPEFGRTEIEAALRSALIERLGLKPRLAFAPVRAALTGRRISPPLFESIELLGRESTLARIDAARTTLDA
jgi:glutamyl-tRNA synthetase